MHANSIARRCTKCQQPGEFNRDRTRSDGLDRWCKKCRRERARLWAQANPERARANRAAYAAAHPEQVKANHRRWLSRHLDQWALIQQRRRARYAGVVNTLTAREWRDILAYFNHACAYCLRTDRPLTMEHVVALSRGGGTTAENIIPACRSCNSKKYAHGILYMVAQ